MVKDALAADHLIGMIQPVSGTIFDDTPEIHKVGCAGRITSYNETSDGRIVMVLTGVCRFFVKRELDSRHGYRRVHPDWERFAGDYHEDESRLAHLESFLDSLRAYASLRGVEIPWDDVTSMKDAELINLLCAHLPLEPDDKQALIETRDLRDRAALMRGLMDMSSASSVDTADLRH
jgi:Lon protease-like protein